MEEQAIKSKPYSLTDLLRLLLLRPFKFFQNFNEIRNENHIIILLTLAGITRGLDRAQVKSLGDKWELDGVLLFSIIMGVLLGWLSFYIYGAMVSGTSTWINGSITTKNAVAAMAYAAIPTIISMFFLFVQVMIFGNAVFQSEIFIDTFSIEWFAFYILSILELIFGIYSFILFAIGLAAIQKFSIAKGFLNALLPAIIFLAIIGIVFMISNMLQ